MDQASTSHGWLRHVKIHVAMGHAILAQNTTMLS